MIPAKKIAKKIAKKSARKSGAHTQVAALCYRFNRKKRVEVLLITSRGTRRWIPPKGWPIEGLAPQKAAAQEAFEEAGVKGRVYRHALGRYDYLRDPEQGDSASAEAYIFPLEVKKLVVDFKEKGQRKIRWFSLKKAAMLVREPKLKKIILRFDPSGLDWG